MYVYIYKPNKISSLFTFRYTVLTMLLTKQRIYKLSYNTH